VLLGRPIAADMVPEGIMDEAVIEPDIIIEDEDIIEDWAAAKAAMRVRVTFIVCMLCARECV